MKTVILAAGEGTRMRPLTNDTPKPLIKTVRHQTLLELIIEALPEQVDELILVVGYKGDQIVHHFGDHYDVFKPRREWKVLGEPEVQRTLRVTYVTQEKAEGTYRALELCRPHLSSGERFVMLYGDDVYGAKDLAKIVDCQDLALLTSTVADPTKFGVLEVNEQGYITGVEEKPAKPKSNIVSTGAMFLDDSVFNYPPQPGSKGEYVLADAIGLMVDVGVPFRAIEVKEWIPIGYPQDLQKLDRRHRKVPPRLATVHQDPAPAHM